MREVQIVMFVRGLNLHPVSYLSVSLLEEVFAVFSSIKVAGKIFQHCYTMTDQYYHSLSSDATIFVSHKCPAIGQLMGIVIA